MRLVSIDTALFDKYQGDPEVLTKSKRPYVLVIRLKYKEKNYDFAVPIRSNIPAAAPKSQYFALPPRPTTRPKNRHGLHYIKMFPVTKQYLIRYRTEGNKFATLIQDIIDKNTKTIVTDCQNYLDLYAEGHHPLFSTDIDYLLSQLFPEKTVIQSGIPEGGANKIMKTWNDYKGHVKAVDPEIAKDIEEIEDTSANVAVMIEQHSAMENSEQ